MASAVLTLTRALELVGSIADPHLEAVAQARLGQAHLTAGRLDAARTHLALAGSLRRRIPDPDEDAELRRSLDDLAQARRRPGSRPEPSMR